MNLATKFNPLSALVRPFTQLAPKMRWPNRGGGYNGTGFGANAVPGAFLGGLLPGSDINWNRQVGDPTLNSTVHSCLTWITNNIAEPEPVVEELNSKGEWVRVTTHDLLAAVQRGNAEYGGDQLHQALAADYPVSGNGYWVIERNNRGRAFGFWWKPSWTMTPAWQDGEFLSGYFYRPGDSGERFFYPKEDVLHFRWGLDGVTEGRFGRSRTGPIAREICTLNEGSTYTHAVLANVGVPSYLFQPKDGQPIAPGALQSLKEWFQNRLTRDGRGRPLLPNIAIEAERLGMSPEEMRVDMILQRPELRVVAAFGIHPATVFMATDPKGLDNGGQQHQARKQSYQDCLVPMLKSWARTITKHQLAPDERQTGRILRFRYDFTHCDALAEDRNAVHERARKDYQAGGLTLNEFRAKIGEKPVPGGDTYASDTRGNP